MLIYLLTARPWLVGLTGGLIFGTTFAGVTALTAPEPVSWQVATIAGVIAGVLFGSVLAYGSVRRQRDLRDAAGHLPRAQQLDAARAAVSGQLPADPQIRIVAMHIAQRRIDELHHDRFPSAIMAALLWVVVGVNLAIGEYLLAIFLSVGALLNSAQLFQLRRTRRQLQRLSAHP
jgi:hypothetical protein